MEPMIAVGLLAIVASSTLYAMASSNRFAVSQRYVSNAKALCQERIDEALTVPFQTGVTSQFFGTWPLSASETQIRTNPSQPAPPTGEPVSLYTMADSGATQLVTGERKTYVTAFTNTGADFVRVRVRVEFWVSGRGLNNKRQTQTGALPYFYEMTTLRSPD